MSLSRRPSTPKEGADPTAEQRAMVRPPQGASGFPLYFPERRGWALYWAGKEGAGSLFSSGDGSGGLSGLLKALKLEDIDPGDILLLLIILFLLVEGDDLELVIALGLVLLMGLGDREGED